MMAIPEEANGVLASVQCDDITRNRLTSIQVNIVEQVHHRHDRNGFRRHTRGTRTDNDRSMFLDVEWSRIDEPPEAVGGQKSHEVTENVGDDELEEGRDGCTLRSVRADAVSAVLE